MTGSAAYAARPDAAAVARDRLDDAAAAVASLASAQRTAVAALLELWPTSAWIAAGASSAKAWLLAYTGVSEREAFRLERIAGLCDAHPTLAEAVLSGGLSMRRTEKLAVAVTQERAPFLAGSLDALLELNRSTRDESAFDEALRYWSARVDEHVAPRTDHPHTLVASQRLFGGGEIHADLTPSAFLNVMTAVDAWTQDPDPTDAPHQRTLAERRADALDDLAHFSLTGHDNGTGEDVEDEELWAQDTFDGTHPTDDLDEALDLSANVHIDLRTLASLRDLTDLHDLVLRGEGWTITKQAAERLLCDSALVATLFDGKTTVLDANDAAEQFTRRQRRALAARDGHCVFPSCQRPPRFCDAHHVHHREHGGPTRTDNGALLCRFHHRLVHEHGWTLTVDNGQWIAIDRRGTRWTGRPTPVTVPATGRARPPDRPTDQSAA